MATPQRQLATFATAGAHRSGTSARFARGFVRVVLGRLFRIRLEGQVPTTGPYILVANHQGWADAFLLIALLPPEPRLYFVGDLHGISQTWWKRGILRWLGGVVAVQRDGSSERAAIDIILNLLAQGAVVGIFAEGRVSHAEAQLAPFRRGVGYLAIRARVPVVPVWLRGTAELYLGRELVACAGAPCAAPVIEPTKHETAAFADELHARLASLATPWIEPEVVRKRWRWMTNIL